MPLVNLIRLTLLAVLGVAGLTKGVKYLSKRKVFVSFAIEDKSIRDLLVGQSKNSKTPFSFVDMSVKKPWSKAWKTQCRARIKSCHGVLVLVSENTVNADGVHWEIKCAKEEGVPIRAIYAASKAKGCALPIELKGSRVYKWSWSNIENFIKQLPKKGE